jgi:hypothetical protein
VQRRVATIASAVSPYLYIIWAQSAFSRKDYSEGVRLSVWCLKEFIKTQLMWRQLDRQRSFVERYANQVDVNETGFAIR